MPDKISEGKMGARVLILDSSIRGKIKELVDLATLNPYSLEEIQALAKGSQQLNDLWR